MVLTHETSPKIKNRVARISIEKKRVRFSEAGVGMDKFGFIKKNLNTGAGFYFPAPEKLRTMF